MLRGTIPKILYIQSNLTATFCGGQSINWLLFKPPYNGHFLLSPRWPLWRGLNKSQCTDCPPKTVYCSLGVASHFTTTMKPQVKVKIQSFLHPFTTSHPTSQLHHSLLEKLSSLFFIFFFFDLYIIHYFIVTLSRVCNEPTRWPATS